MSFRCVHATSKGCSRWHEGHPLLESSQSRVAISYGLVMNNVGGGGDRWPRDVIVNRPHHPDAVCRVCRPSNRRAGGRGVDGVAGRRAPDRTPGGRPKRGPAAAGDGGLPAWLPLEFSRGARPTCLTIARAVVNRDGWVQGPHQGLVLTSGPPCVQDTRRREKSL